MTVADDEITSNNNYHEPMWLRGLHDYAGILKAAMESGHMVDNCEINVTEDFANNDGTVQDTANNFILSVCRLNGLQSLRLLPETFKTIYVFPVSLLTLALQEAVGLQMLSLCSLELVGTNEEFEQFHYQLGNHQSIHLVRLIRCRLPGVHRLAPRILEALVRSLSNMEYLTEVELSAVDENSSWRLSDNSFECLYRSSTLETLQLDNFDMSIDQMRSLLQSLEDNTSNLKGISLSSCESAFGNTQEGWRGLSRMLATNRTLEECSIWAAADKENQLPPHQLDACLAHMAQSLQDNTTLRNLQISINGQQSELKKPSFSQPCQESVVDMIGTHNTTLESMHIFGDKFGAHEQDQINFYLALNRMGRKELLMENATKNDFIRVLAKSQENLSCLFFFLSMRPELLG